MTQDDKSSPPDPSPEELRSISLAQKVSRIDWTGKGPVWVLGADSERRISSFPYELLSLDLLRASLAGHRASIEDGWIRFKDYRWARLMRKSAPDPRTSFGELLLHKKVARQVFYVWWTGKQFDCVQHGAGKVKPLRSALALEKIDLKGGKIPVTFPRHACASRAAELILKYPGSTPETLHHLALQRILMNVMFRDLFPVDVDAVVNIQNVDGTRRHVIVETKRKFKTRSHRYGLDKSHVWTVKTFVPLGVNYLHVICDDPNTGPDDWARYSPLNSFETESKFSKMQWLGIKLEPSHVVKDEKPLITKGMGSGSFQRGKREQVRLPSPVPITDAPGLFQPWNREFTSLLFS